MNDAAKAVAENGKNYCISRASSCTGPRLWREYRDGKTNGTGTVKVRFADVSGSRDGFWTSEPVAVSNAKGEYTVEYRHSREDVDDVRLAFLFGHQARTILLDRIALRGYRE